MAASLLSPTFVIGQLRIGSVEGASCVNFGNNLPSGFASRKMHNQGFGSVGGDGNTIRGARSTVRETEGEKSQAAEDEGEVPDWIRELITASFKDYGGETSEKEGRPNG
ncbi:hypothetical protein N6H14_00590 [Paenibacillus sp. CC-CFT747]|nr:hypothetical protein N6H14_00590 [Paenibacillus sp. CC-CFT747]